LRDIEVEEVRRCNEDVEEWEDVSIIFESNLKANEASALDFSAEAY
jgi:hypothetical protein